MIHAKFKLVWITAQTGARRGIGFYDDCDMEISINPFWNRISDNFFFTKASIKQKIQFFRFSREGLLLLFIYLYIFLYERVLHGLLQVPVLVRNV